MRWQIWHKWNVHAINYYKVLSSTSVLVFHPWYVFLFYVVTENNPMQEFCAFTILQSAEIKSTTGNGVSAYNAAVVKLAAERFGSLIMWEVCLWVGGGELHTYCDSSVLVLSGDSCVLTGMWLWFKSGFSFTPNRIPALLWKGEVFSYTTQERVRPQCVS